MHKRDTYIVIIKNVLTASKRVLHLHSSRDKFDIYLFKRIKKHRNAIYYKILIYLRYKYFRI